MKKLYTLLFIAITSVSFGQAFTATYDFAGIPANATNGLVDPTAVPTAPGVTFGSFHAVNAASTATGSSGQGRFSYALQPLGATNGNDDYFALTGTIDPGVYYEVVITPAANQGVSISTVTFKSQRSGTGVRTFAVRSSIDGYAANLAASVTSETANIQAGNVFFVMSDANTATSNVSVGNTLTLNYSNIVEPITLRFYGFNAEGTGGTFSIDDVVINGSTGPLGVNDNQIAGLKVYPNPVVNGTLFIDTNAAAQKAVVIYDVLGKQVLNTKTTTNAVNVSSLKGGVYIVKITEEGNTATRKLVIK